MAPQVTPLPVEQRSGEERSREPGSRGARLAVHRYRRRTASRLRLGAAVLLAIVGLVAGVASLMARRMAPVGSEPLASPATAQASDVRAYQVATGIFAQPAPGHESGDFAAAEALAKQAGTPLAFTVWTDQESFETRAWRDLLQVGRFPYNRPPAIDYAREVAVLVWASPAMAPPDVLASGGLELRAARAAGRAVELRVAPRAGGATPATPAAGGPVLPYLLVTIPRSQWPVPVPPPLVPPVRVALVP